MREDEFNRKATGAICPALLTDKKLVSTASQTTPIELCDILTTAGDLIHVKRHFGSSDLILLDLCWQKNCGRTERLRIAGTLFLQRLNG